MSGLWIAVVALAVAPTQGSMPAPIASPPAAVDRQPLVPFRTGPELRDAVRLALRRWARPSDKEADLAAREFLVLYRGVQADDQLARGHREQLRTKVRGRLLKLAQQINKRVAIGKRLAKSKRPESVDAAAEKNDVLAQFGGFARPAFGGPGLGAPGFGGPELVELIQRTIAPSTWNVNGGPGSIYYWIPGRAIVVRQMGEVHNQIGGVLEQMRR